MKNFLEYVKESSEVKEVIDYDDIVDKFNGDKNRVVEYLRNLLMGKIITVWYKDGDEQTMKSVDGLKRSEVYSVECGSPFVGAARGTLTINNHFIVRGDQINILNDKRKLNLEDDPFGEENYGHIQESNNWTENTLMELWDDLNGDKDKINQQLNKSISGKEITFMWKEKVITDTIGKAEYNGDVFVFYTENGYRYSGVNLMYPIEALGDRRNKRIVNLEDDPFGEEDYGSIQESVMDYEFLKNYIIGFSDTEQMIDIAKKIKDIGFKVYNYDEILGGENYEYSGYVWSKIYDVFNRCSYNKEGNWIYIRYNDFIDLISKDHITRTYSDDDPFGEEI